MGDLFHAQAVADAQRRRRLARGGDKLRSQKALERAKAAQLFDELRGGIPAKRAERIAAYLGQPVAHHKLTRG